jgi:hypothetical protein
MEIITDCSLEALRISGSTPCKPEVTLACLECSTCGRRPVELSCLCRYDCPDPCYVLISDRTMCEGSGKGGNAERFHAIAFMTTHFDQHCDVMLTMPAPTPPDSWLRTRRWLSLSAHARRAVRLGGITSGEHNQVNLGLWTWFGTTRARQRKGACMSSLPTHTCACMCLLCCRALPAQHNLLDCPG